VGAGRRIIGAREVFLHIRYIVPFRNEGDSDRGEKSRQSYFALFTPVKFGEDKRNI